MTISAQIPPSPADNEAPPPKQPWFQQIGIQSTDFYLSFSPAPPPHPHPFCMLCSSHTLLPTLSQLVLSATHPVVITGGRLCRPKRVVIGPVAVPLWVVSPVALLTGPLMTQCAFPKYVILMQTGHQGPATTFMSQKVW